MTFDTDWDDDAEEELRSIEIAYASTKRKSSDFDHVAGDESSAPRRRLPAWANGASPSISSPGDLGSEIVRCISNVDRPSGSCLRNDLWTFSPTPCRVNLKLKHPVFTFDGRTVYSRTLTEVERSTIEILDKIEHLKHNADEISLGFDIEWRPVFRAGQTIPKTAVLQICMDSSDCYVMHIIHSGVPPILKSLLEDPSSSKVGIGIGGDATKISRDYNVCVTPLVDLSKYANLKLGGAPKNWGLSSLTEALTCKELLKPYKIRLGNWEANELSKEQLHYAATDAFASWYLYQILKTFPDPKPES
ncbi:Werner Syndrome-like exonuclease [Platanthera zijinensis]|uniref:3'-5' exonuclease n=1 Tax=Platanthera zijinensis TaxID=2320716 RepID=A0AAP0BCR3_9ASPA